ncbi:hypothetical protein NDU88_001258 [Pleurodeles waltl]|uniref:Uncharacterized protein n=1 Tax=Pleurodeles waltl TaxID=8319 RepID=A0AAV7Q5G6_PLEWA|nr:hypothetical protein NDU88_001258 [Pleurodeles waltl]
MCIDREGPTRGRSRVFPRPEQIGPSERNGGNEQCTVRPSASEALQHKRPTSPPVGPHTALTPAQPSMMTDKDQSTTMERILQEITAVSRRREGLNASISSLTLETKSIRSDIASFQSQVTGLEHCVGTLETQMATTQGRDQDLLYLRSKITDLEDRSRRDKICLFGIPENEEGSDVQAFLSSVLPKLTSLTLDPPLEFQRANRVGPKRPDGATRPRPIIACLLRHIQTHQLLQVALNHGPFQMDKYEIRITADYSKDTNERRKAFLALRPRLRQLEIKYGLFDPARMWVTKNGECRDFYNPEDLRIFSDSFQHQPKDSSTPTRPQDNLRDDSYIPPVGPERGDAERELSERVYIRQEMQYEKNQAFEEQSRVKAFIFPHIYDISHIPSLYLVIALGGFQ